MNEILTATIRILTLVFLIACTSGIGMGLSWQQPATPFKSAKLVVVAVIAIFLIVADHFQSVLRISGTGAILAAMLLPVLSALTG